jgi:O-acetyl-ADP-ribose deacetylase (regulator of RNase III)
MIEILRASIVTLDVDAIVNAANESLRGGGGVDGVIHAAAGPELLEACRRYARVATGDAVITEGYRLPARYVIHAVGPIWRGNPEEAAALLAHAYESVFRVAAASADIRTIVFPAISTGAYGFPKGDAARIAVHSLLRHEPEYDRIVVCVMDAENAAAYRDALRAAIR